MALMIFDRDFPWWGRNPNCKLCALALWMFKRSGRAIEVPDEAADAAEAAGAGRRIAYEVSPQ